MGMDVEVRCIPRGGAVCAMRWWCRGESREEKGVCGWGKGQNREMQREEGNRVGDCAPFGGEGGVACGSSRRPGASAAFFRFRPSSSSVPHTLLLVLSSPGIIIPGIGDDQV